MWTSQQIWTQKPSKRSNKGIPVKNSALTTGRLSPPTPALQNIPIRTLEGLRVREAFREQPRRQADFLVQGTGSAEERTAKLRSILGTFLVYRAIPGEPLSSDLLNGLRTGHLVPLGSVEFVRACLEELTIPEPPPLEGFSALHDHLHRDVKAIPAARLLSPPFCQGLWFVKPVAVKLFSGFLWSHPQENCPPPPSQADDDYTREQHAALARILETSPDTPLWVSSPVRILREDRVYVLDGTILGQARYDPSDVEIPRPNARVIQEMVARLSKAPGTPCAYSLDVGVLEVDGTPKTALIELNDAWALGLYRGMDDKDGYLEMLAARWREIVSG